MKRKILILGAGRSSSYLIQYLLQNAKSENWELLIADQSIEAAKKKLDNHPHGTPISLNILDANLLSHAIQNADIVVSLLPPSLHIIAAKECVTLSKNLVTASYLTDDIRQLDDTAKEKGIILLNECGLDPGLDHMSAMKIIVELRKKGAEIKSFKSYCGGLISPESNDNCWGYKFTWNPRNVVLAGQGTAKYIQDSKYHYIPYSRLFKTLDQIEIPDMGLFEGYPNRDSLSYRSVYGLENIPTLLRGTLRQKDFCTAWDVFVQLGLTDDSFMIEHADRLTYKQWVQSFLPYQNKLDQTEKSVEQCVCQLLNLNQKDPIVEKIRWTGIFSDNKIPLSKASPAAILQDLLETKWGLNSKDKDMIVMQHIFEYTLNKQPFMLKSSMTVLGEDNTYTAMAKTVGLPCAIAVKNILNQKIIAKGAQIPTSEDIYEPILEELKQYEIKFLESVERLS